MKLNFKKVVLIIILCVIVLGIIALAVVSGRMQTKKKTDNIKIVVSNFASYDFLREIIGDCNDVELEFLVGPGKDTHSFDPTAQDIVDIQEADVFVYIGGEMEKWAPKVIDSLEDSNIKIVCIADDIDTIDEKEVDGAESDEEEEEEGAFDEHIWTSPKNAISMVESLEKVMEDVDSKNSEMYRENADNYIEKINDVDNKIQEIVDNRVRNRLLFGDKMPMQYFIDYYNLDVSAAFNGCSTDTDPSSKTISYLVDVAKKDKIPVILYIELNDGKVARTIADEVGNGCVPMQIQTIHNVSKDDFDNGETYVSLMNRNIDVLKKALQ